MVGKCIFTTDGPFWEHSRALFRPHFARGEINDLKATERAVQDLLQAVLVGSNEGERWTREIDLQALFLRFTLDTGTEFLFGGNAKSQLAAIPGAAQPDSNAAVTGATCVAADQVGGTMTFTEAFRLATVEVAKRAKLQSLYWLADSKESRRAVRYLQKFIDHLVDVQLHHRGGDQPGREKHTLLEALAQDTQDPIELRDQLLLMLTASRDTTASLLSWMFLMLAKYPAIFQRLRTEIIKEFGTKGDPKEITFYGLKKCLYLQWTMFETLRLYPPAPLNARVALKDTTLPVGGGPDGKSPTAMRKGQTVNICVYAMHRRADLWGDDVMEYKPERWDGRKTDWAFLPFSGGPRSCLGSEFFLALGESRAIANVGPKTEEYALTEAAFLTVRLLQHFDEIQAVEDLTNIPQFLTVTLEATHGVKVCLRKAA
jgi:cytochrome P450